MTKKIDVVEEIHNVTEKISRMSRRELRELDKAAQQLEKKAALQ